MQIPPATSLAFTLAAQPGAYALLVGAGVSISAGMKSAWHVQRELILQLAATEGAEAEALGTKGDETAPFTWFEAKYGEEATYDRLIGHSAPSPSQRFNLLRNFFRATDNDRRNGLKQPMPAHKAMAALVANRHIRIIVTLNFDHLIEEAIRAVGLEPVVVNTEAGIEGLQPLHEYECLIVHLHGDYTHPEMRNTPDELGAYSQTILHFMQRLQEDYGLLATGWSGQWDPALRDAIDSVGSTRYPMYWVNPSAPTHQGADLARRKRAIVCESAADDFFPDLQARIAAIEERSTRHPLDAAALVSTAKRELDNRTSRCIATHDNLRNEIRALHGMDEYINLRSLANLADPEMERWTGAILEQVKPLAALLATLAFWGTEETDGWWLDGLGKIAPSRYGNWKSGDEHLRPGALFYAVCGTAAIAAGRYTIAARLLAEPSPVEFARRAVDIFGASAFCGTRDRGPSPSRQVFELVEPILRESLLLTESDTRESWDTWQYLELVHGTHLDNDNQDASTHSMVPHIRLLPSGNLPAVHEEVRNRLLGGESEWGPEHDPVMKLLFNGDPDKFRDAIDKTNAWLIGGGIRRRTGRTYYDD